MKKYLKTFLLQAAMLLSFSNAFSQLDSFSFYRPQEKAYLFTDKQTYVAGETIWFKTFTSLFEKPGILSTVAYVTLTDQQGKIILKKMLSLKNGSAAGELEIDGSLETGTYSLSTYTLWMLNFPDFIFAKNINIINTTQKTTLKKPGFAEASISFFPEGGNMIAGVNNRVAFKAIDANNQPMQVSGTITDDKNKAVAQITTVHDGMGTVEFIPAAGTVYKATVSSTGGKEIQANLPVATAEGITMSVDNSSASKTFIKISRGEKNKAAFNELQLVAQQNYKVVYVAKLNLDEGLDAVAINKKNFAPGIMVITILDNSGIPLCERIVFVANYTQAGDLLNLTANTDRRAKNTITLDLSAFESPDAAIAVSNAEADPEPAKQNILSSFLLSSDIKGYIHQPAFYFRDKDSATLQKLDLVMLTNGWRRYKWEEMMQNKYPDLHYPFETGLSITGKVMKVNGRTELKNGKINLIIKGEDSTSIMSEAVLNERSEFIIDKLYYKKNATVYYQGTNQQKQNALVSVTIDPVYYDTVKTSFFLKDNAAGIIPVSTALNDMLSQKQKADTRKAKLLEEVVVKSKRMSPEDSATKVYASPIFENSDQTLLPDQSDLNFDVWQFMQRKVPGMLVDRSGGTPKVNFSRYNGLDFFNEDTNSAGGVQFFLNEVPVSADIIDGLNPADIGIVKVFKGATGIALGAARGAIALYTIKGRSTRDWRIKGFDFFKKSGYSVNREFYQMDYSKLNPESEFSDVRSTLYWNPSISIKDGKAVLDFYNDDVTKKFRVVAEGIDKNGKLLHVEKIVP